MSQLCLDDSFGSIISSILVFILVLAGCLIFHYRRESLYWYKHHLDLKYTTIQTEHAYKMTIQSLENTSKVKEFVMNHYRKKLSRTEPSASSIPFNELRPPHSHHEPSNQV